MQKRSSKGIKKSQIREISDVQRIAKSVTDNLIIDEPMPEKNPAAVALGRLGGLKGGKARAEKLSPRRRKQIAKRAALARWNV